MWKKTEKKIVNWHENFNWLRWNMALKKNEKEDFKSGHCKNWLVFHENSIVMVNQVVPVYKEKKKKWDKEVTMFDNKHKQTTRLLCTPQLVK